MNQQQYSQLNNEIESICTGAMQLPGWCTAAKGIHLAELITERKPATVVEIGVFGGRSFVPIVLALKQLGGERMAYGIDAWTKSAALAGMNEHDADDKSHVEWWSKLDFPAIMRRCADYLEERRLWPFAALIQGRSENLAALFAPGSIDLLHIDGNHTAECSCRDVRLWLPLVRPGGIVVMDDTNWPSTAPAVALLAQGCHRLSVHPGVGTEYQVFQKTATRVHDKQERKPPYKAI